MSSGRMAFSYSGMEFLLKSGFGAPSVRAPGHQKSNRWIY